MTAKKTTAASAAKKTSAASAAKKTRAKKAPAPAAKPTEEVVVGEVVGDEVIDTRSLSRRYAALKALEAGIKTELSTVQRTLLSASDRLGVSSFSSDFGKLTVAQRSATFSVNDEEAYIQHFVDEGAGSYINEIEEPDMSRIDEIVAVLKKHAPELVKKTVVVPEFLEVGFMNSLIAKTRKIRKPVLDDDGNPMVDSELNPITGEVVDTPRVDETEESYAVRKITVDVPQNDGSTVEQSAEERVDFITVKPGSKYLSYPATKEQKEAKRRAELFFESGDLTIARAIPRATKEIASGS